MTKRTGDARRRLELKREPLRVLSAEYLVAAVGGGTCEGSPLDPQRDGCGRAYSKTCRFE
jgi:hypothetical protein